MTEGYNGWKNFETWTVSLWLGNEEADYKRWTVAAQDEWYNSKGAASVFNGLRTRGEAATSELADRMRVCYEERAETLLPCGLLRDLLQAAIDRADWEEVATPFVEAAMESDEERTDHTAGCTCEECLLARASLEEQRAEERLIEEHAQRQVQP
jgi:hypothetical protein